MQWWQPVFRDIHTVSIPGCLLQWHHSRQKEAVLAHGKQKSRGFDRCTSCWYSPAQAKSWEVCCLYSSETVAHLGTMRCPARTFASCSLARHNMVHMAICCSQLLMILVMQRMENYALWCAARKGCDSQSMKEYWEPRFPPHTCAKEVC